MLPSYRETPGLASMEAAAVGCAVIVTEEGSAREYFGDLAGYADPRSSASIARAVLDAVQAPHQPALRHHMQAYDWLAVGEELLAAYRSLAANSRHT